MENNIQDPPTSIEEYSTNSSLSPQEPETGVKQVGRYVIRKLLGAGAMGEVYLGWDPYIKRPVAIKTSRLTTEKARTRFFIEAQSAGRLNHPNIVTMYDVGEHDDLSYIAMEYVAGGTLNRYCQPSELLPAAQAIKIVIGLCEGLSYAHNQKVIHRDIKPSNIIVSPAGVPKIMDFGIALIAQRIKKSRITGTPYYMSPEQMRGKKVQHVSDIFALGCVLYELLCGQKAFKGSSFAEIKQRVLTGWPVPLSRLDAQLPPALDQIMKKALAKNPFERYQACKDLAHDLGTALRSLPGERDVDTSDNIIRYLYQIKFFKDFSEDQLNLILAATKVISVQAGRVIFAEGDVGDIVYIILNGKVSVIDKNDEFVGYLTTGEVFGERAFLGNQIRSASIMAEVNSVLMETSTMVIDSLPDAIKVLFYKNLAISLINRFSA